MHGERNRLQEQSAIRNVEDVVIENAALLHTTRFIPFPE
jgi:hypothetical protein